MQELNRLQVETLGDEKVQYCYSLCKCHEHCPLSHVKFPSTRLNLFLNSSSSSSNLTFTFLLQLRRLLETTSAPSSGNFQAGASSAVKPNAEAPALAPGKGEGDAGEEVPFIEPLEPYDATCFLAVGKTLKKFNRCYKIGTGAAYFTLEQETGLLQAGFRASSTGWAALSVGKPHAGASAVWSRTCGNTCARAGGVIMNGFSGSSIGFPSKIKFSNITAAKSEGEHLVAFTMPFPESGFIQVALATGKSSKNKHNILPKVYIVTKYNL